MSPVDYRQNSEPIPLPYPKTSGGPVSHVFIGKSMEGRFRQPSFLLLAGTKYSTERFKMVSAPVRQARGFPPWGGGDVGGGGVVMQKKMECPISVIWAQYANLTFLSYNLQLENVINFFSTNLKVWKCKNICHNISSAVAQIEALYVTFPNKHEVHIKMADS